MNFYPPAPASVSPEKLQPSTGFKSQVKKVIVSISVFFVAYVIMIALAAGLAVACVYGGFAIVLAGRSILAILLGLGVVALGLSVFFFLIKFIFTVSKDEKASRIQVTEEQQPALFAFIRKISEETLTPFPKKIFLSPDVNACVFYNSSFWSMFFPVKKNLEIGLGLVNSLNLSELKAVIAHEFGHFSQRSMKLGSFTYNVNRVIFNMLYENQGYGRFLHGWGSVSGEMAIFANITIKIAEFIQWILRGFYKMINKNYMGLSREMEFHADAIAASVSGGNNLVSALSRIEIAAGCFQSAINKANDAFHEKKLSKNIFTNQLSIYHQFANDHQLPISNNLPELSFAFVESFSKSRINFQNQWASHPTLGERKAHLENLGMDCMPVEHAAWVVFRNPDQLQEEITSQIYSQTETDISGFAYYDNNSFNQMMAETKAKYALPKPFNGYYDNRFIDTAGWDLEALKATHPSIRFDQLFHAGSNELQKNIEILERDIETLQSISKKEIDTSTFDFDGDKYTREQCDEVIEKLQKELNDQKQIQKQQDQQAFVLFSQHAPSVKEHYKTYQLLQNEQDSFIKIATAINTLILPLFGDNNSTDKIWKIINPLKADHEPLLKRFLNQYLCSRSFSEQEQEFQTLALRFVNASYVYFAAGEFHNNEMQDLIAVMQQLESRLVEEKFSKYKLMLEDQVKYTSLN